MQELKRLRFIPFRRSDLVQMCLEEGDPALHTRFRATGERIEKHFREEFHDIKQQLKNAYGPLDPDADTRLVAEFRSDDAPGQLAQLVSGLPGKTPLRWVQDTGASLSRPLRVALPPLPP